MPARAGPAAATPCRVPDGTGVLPLVQIAAVVCGSALLTQQVVTAHVRATRPEGEHSRLVNVVPVRLIVQIVMGIYPRRPTDRATSPALNAAAAELEAGVLEVTAIRVHMHIAYGPLACGMRARILNVSAEPVVRARIAQLAVPGTPPRGRVSLALTALLHGVLVDEVQVLVDANH